MITLMYHDIVEDQFADTSGFIGADANHYKLSPETFAAHLASAKFDASRVVLTFDDGGVSALSPCADILELSGMRGLFFIPTDFIGRPGHCSAEHLRQLSARGHLLGSHSASHPVPISQLPASLLADQWSRSRAVLQDLIGSDIKDASVPGGFTSDRVEQAAADAGYRRLLTSAPTRFVRHVGDMRVYGRFSITRSTSVGTVARVIAGQNLPWLKQAAFWEAKKILKLLGGPTWLRLRQEYFRRSRSRQ